MGTKLLAEWFSTDRWMVSPAFLLPMEARGLHRELLTLAVREGGSVPGVMTALLVAVNCTEPEWRRAWPLICSLWRVQNGRLVPLEPMSIARPLPGQSDHRPHIPLAVRRQVFERDGFACVFCGSCEGLSLDHRVPFSDGGPDTVDNLQVACMDCNRSKGSRC